MSTWTLGRIVILAFGSVLTLVCGTLVFGVVVVMVSALVGTDLGGV